MLKNNKKKKILIGLKKAQSSLKRIVDLLEDESKNNQDQCFSIIQQNLSIIGLLKSVNINMLENHIDLYIREVEKKKIGKKKLDKMKEEILKTIRNAQK